VTAFEQIAEAAAVKPAVPLTAGAAVSEYGTNLTASDSNPPSTQAFSLSSRPASVNKIWLDFRGASYTGTAWNNFYNRATITVPAYSMDYNPKVSTKERQT
jgi:hypothetical protein